MSLKFLKPEYRKKQFELAEAVSISFAYVAPDKQGAPVFAATYEQEPAELLAKLKKETGFSSGVAGSLRVKNKVLELTPIKPFPSLRKAVIELAKAEGWSVKKARLAGEPEVSAAPTATSEVISGASGLMYSQGNLTETTAGLGEDFGKGVRENAYFNITGDQNGELGTRGSAPMQSPRLKSGRTFARRHGLGFLCWDYSKSGMNNLADVKEYQTPGSAYLKAFNGMDKTKQIENPTSQEMVDHMLHAIKDLAAYGMGTPGHSEEWGELVVSFQGHGGNGIIYGVDGNKLKPSILAQLADAAEKRQVSLTLVLDGCFTGQAVEVFQNRVADAADTCVAAAEAAGAAPEKAALWKRKMAMARRMIKFSRVFSKFSDQLRDVESAMKNPKGVDQPSPAHGVERAARAMADAVLLLSAMRDQLAPELATPMPGGPDLQSLCLAFEAKIRVCQAPPPKTEKAYRSWMGEIGHMRDRVSDTANLLLEAVDREARAAAQEG
jgi:hypothetical protein